ncbi:MAG: hypothetical protein WA771_00860, partial [Chthoniobacterales bacterium]
MPVRTFDQALAFVRQHGIVGIFGDRKSDVPSLWNVVDLPERQPGEKGWGRKVSAVWSWKNEIPATYPNEIFYGKLPNGQAVLMTMDRLAAHYADTHRPLRDCSPLARELHTHIALDPTTTGALRKLTGMNRPPERGRFDKALLELQTTLNVVRRNDPKDKNDTWIPFAEQHVD